MTSEATIKENYYYQVELLLRCLPYVAAEEVFGLFDADVPTLYLPDVYAGKLCAALDRQHPRDLFGVKLLLEKVHISKQYPPRVRAILGNILSDTNDKVATTQ